MRTDPKKRLQDNIDAPKARHGILFKNIYKPKEKDNTTFYSPSEEWVLPVTSNKEPEEREFVVDCGASMHTVSKKDLNLKMSRNPTTVMTANGEVQTRDEATEKCQRIGLLRDGYAS